MHISVDDVLNGTREEKINFLDSVIDDALDPLFDSSPVLEHLVQDEDEDVRALAVAALWDFSKVEMIDPLFDMVYHDPSLKVRSRAVATLGRFIYEGTISDYDYPWSGEGEIVPDEFLSQSDFLRVRQFLVNLFQDQSQPLDVRRFAVESLSFLTEPDIIAIIREAYESPDSQMKVSAIFAMGRNANEAWAEVLLRELKSLVPEIRFEATRSAGEFSLQEAAPILMELALSDDQDLSLEAIWSLGRTGGPGVRFFLEHCAENTDPDIAEVADAALDELDLVEMVSDLESDVPSPDEYDPYISDDDDDDDL